MNAPHIHLMLNHVPVLGTMFGLGLLLFAFWRKRDELKKVALGIFVFSALFSVPVYLTGEPAEDAVKAFGISEPLIESHEEAASVAFTGVVVLGVVALAGLLRFRRNKAVPVWFGSLVLIASLAVSGFMAWTANLGGQIRHPEIRQPVTAAPAGEKHRN